MKRIFLSLLFILAVYLANAQYYKSADTLRRGGFDKSRLIIGGSLGAVFGDYTNLDISPIVGYRFNDYIAAGININGQYGSYRLRDINDNTIQRDKYTIFGAGVWGRVYPIPVLFVHIQPENNFINQSSTYYNGAGQKTTYKTNYSVPSLLVGAGYTQGIGGRVGIGISILYDVIQDARSPYRNNVVYRVGAGLGF
ncbi:hypothetical protein J2T02_002855 [Chitinophaga terrae (ex Kim and Jung 2007)]|uniref:hypothetical protein n=1 Tax=Chitinophaga terrae (ex Kim and Jung 2007) TaxID=408074 RepID=UPI002786A514|nr:hypothetical protein [Chitinophaga terrae (ex Kim and Jung 2007)]MDQ0107734.1 hypothetical protein [Chitinophaga terrae (ex Kim and Jung 2007)]